MYARIAAVLFGLALLLELLNESFGRLINATTLTTAGLLFVALQLAGLGTSWARGNWSRRRR